MQIFNLEHEQEWKQEKQVEKILGKFGDGDVAGAYWEPGQISPYHCHPGATEIYFCFSGGGTMRTPERVVEIAPGTFVIHPPGEMHEFVNGPQRTLLFRVRYGEYMRPRFGENRQLPLWRQSEEDAEFFRTNPHLLKAEVHNEPAGKHS